MRKRAHCGELLQANPPRAFTRFGKMICDANFLDALPSLNYTSAVSRTPY
jgi:hypothetical protein